MDTKQKMKQKLASVLDKPNLVAFFEKNISSSPIQIKKGSFLSNEGQPLERVFIIKKGFVKLYSLSSEGRETIVYLLGPGYVLGARAFIAEDDRAIHNAQALTDLEVLSISHQEYLELISSNPDYLIDLLQIFINRLVYTEKKLSGFIVGDTKGRIAQFLIDIYERFGDKTQKPIILPIPLTHQRIAEFVGAFRETVTHSLNLLEKEEVLSFNNGFLVINNLDKLKQYSKIS